MHYAEVEPAGPGHPAQASVAIWAGRLGVGAAAFAVGSALGHAGDPAPAWACRGVGAFAIAAAVTRLRWCLVAVLFLLVAYVPDVLATRSAAHALTAIVLAGAVLRVGRGPRALRPPPRAARLCRARARLRGRVRSSPAIAAPPQPRRSTWSATARSSRC